MKVESSFIRCSTYDEYIFQPHCRNWNKLSSTDPQVYKVNHSKRSYSNPSTPQQLNSSTPQQLNTSTAQHLNPSTPLPSKFETSNNNSQSKLEALSYFLPQFKSPNLPTSQRLNSSPYEPANLFTSRSPNMPNHFNRIQTSQSSKPSKNNYNDTSTSKVSPNQPISHSFSQPSNISVFQPFDPSTPQHLNSSTVQHLNTSTSQPSTRPSSLPHKSLSGFHRDDEHSQLHQSHIISNTTLADLEAQAQALSSAVDQATHQTKLYEQLVGIYTDLRSQKGSFRRSCSETPKFSSSPLLPSKRPVNASTPQQLNSSTAQQLNTSKILSPEEKPKKEAMNLCRASGPKKLFTLSSKIKSSIPSDSQVFQPQNLSTSQLSDLSISETPELFSSFKEDVTRPPSPPANPKLTQTLSPVSDNIPTHRIFLVPGRSQPPDPSTPQLSKPMPSNHMKPLTPQSQKPLYPRPPKSLSSNDLNPSTAQHLNSSGVRVPNSTIFRGSAFTPASLLVSQISRSSSKTEYLS